MINYTMHESGATVGERVPRQRCYMPGMGAMCLDRM